jgi:plasmid maintenance system antidote protein VapI
MEYAGVSPKRFAEILGIERSNVSHIMSGRNNPSLTVVQKILKNFPDISSDWLLFGEGNMLKANATGVNTSVNTNTDAVSAAAPVVNANVAPAPPTNTASANTNVGTSQVHIEPVVEQPRPKVDKPEPPRQPIAPPSSPTPDAQPRKNIEYQTITTPIVTDTNVQPTSTQIQSMLANGLIVLDHSTKTFTVYTQGK